MPTQKKIIIGTRRDLIEATVHNRSEVVDYLKQHNWHLDRENFVRVAPDEYCLVSKSALTPDMDIVFEGVVHAWSTAETTEIKKLREYKSWGTKAGDLLKTETMLLCLVFMVVAVFMWSHIDSLKRVLICAVGLAFIGFRLIIFSMLDDPESDTKNSGK